MKYTEKQLALLRQAQIIDQNDHWINRKLLSTLGDGPKISPSVVDRLFALDPTPDQVWMEWILHQAGGGDRARESSLRAMEQMKQRFMDERLHGYQHAKTREVNTPVDKTTAEERWKQVEPKMAEVLVSADQDTVEKLGVWGFFREWPGNQGLYQKLSEVFRAWCEIQPQLEQMNREMERESKPPVHTGPKDIADIEAMEGICKKVVRYFASKEARDDIRLASWHGHDWIYNDDAIIALCPLTYAASARYGVDAWPWSNRDAFERMLVEENNFSDNWGTPLKKGSFWVFLRFKVPMPRWVSRKNSQFCVYELTNLALELTQKTVGSFTDEEGQTRSLDNVIDTIRSEINRPEDPADSEMPVKRGPCVYTSVSQAENVIAHLKKALAAIEEWNRTFDINRLKVSALDYKSIKPTAGLPGVSPS